MQGIQYFMTNIALIGLGEVGTTLAETFIEAGHTVSGWDPVRKKIKGMQFAANNQEACKDADVIFSANNSAVSVAVAYQVVDSLKDGLCTLM